jgi:Uncharacterised nucleotidyltransferase
MTTVPRPNVGGAAVTAVPAPDGEMALLRECARTTIDEERAAHIRRLVAGPFDWGRLLSIAREHGLLPLLASHLDGLEWVPVAVQEELRVRLRRNTERNVALAGELVRLLGLLRDAGVAAVPFKGPVLATVAYGHLGLREFTDLDFLVNAADIPTARRVLVARGYRPWFDLPAAQESQYVRSRYEHPFRRETDGVIVELQWRIVPAYFGLRLDYAGMWERCESASLAGHRVPSLSPEDLLLVLAVHGTKHLWERLGWVTDVAELLRARPALDWERLRRHAQDSGTRRMLALALGLVTELLGAPMPVGAPVSHEVSHLIQEVVRNQTSPQTGLWRQERFHVKALESRLDRWRYLARLVVGTSPGDWAVVRLPRPLSPLYPVVRVVRVAIKYGGHATRSLARSGARS